MGCRTASAGATKAPRPCFPIVGRGSSRLSTFGRFPASSWSLATGASLSSAATSRPARSGLRPRAPHRCTARERTCAVHRHGSLARSARSSIVGNRSRSTKRSGRMLSCASLAGRRRCAECARLLAGDGAGSGHWRCLYKRAGERVAVCEAGAGHVTFFQRGGSYFVKAHSHHLSRRRRDCHRSSQHEVWESASEGSTR